MMWIYVDEQSRVLGANANNMSGNTGWVAIRANVDEVLDEHGAALYRLENGELVERTEEERRADWPEESVPYIGTDDMLEILGDHEYRICLMELGIEEDELQ